MRTKTLLCMAALAAGVASSMAQSNVYSLNVVGYVNLVYTTAGSGSWLTSNPLDNTNNDLNTIIPTAPDGTGIGLWDEAISDFSSVAPFYSTFDNTWHGGDVVIGPGVGFFLAPAANFTNTYVGTVRQYPVTNTSLGNGLLDCLAAIVPVGGYTTNVLINYPAHDGDAIAVWDESIGDFSATDTPTYSTFDNQWHTDTGAIQVGEGYFLARNTTGAAVTWVSQFTVH